MNLNDIIPVIPYIWLGSVMLMGLKMMYEQFKLLRIYRKEINPPYQLLFYEAPGEDYPEPKPGDKSPINFELLKITFSKHAAHPLVAAQARKVRRDMIITHLIGVGGFILIGVAVYINVGQQ